MYWPITIKFRTRVQTSKPQTIYRSISGLVISSLIGLFLATTCHKYFWCSRVCEFHSQNCRSLQLRSPRKPPCVSSTKIRDYDWLRNADSPAQGNRFPARVQTLFSRRVKQEPKKLSGHSLGRLGRHIWERL